MSPWGSGQSPRGLMKSFDLQSETQYFKKIKVKPELHFCAQSGKDNTLWPGVISGSSWNCNPKSHPWDGCTAWDPFLSGAVLGITDKMEAWSPAPSPHSAGTDPGMKGVRPCNSDLSFPLLSWVDWKGILRCLLVLRRAWEGTKPSAALLRK